MSAKIIADDINRHGFHVSFIFDAPFAYTTGFDDMDSPEILIAGIGTSRANFLMTVFHTVFEMMGNPSKYGQIEDNVRVSDILADHDVIFKVVPEEIVQAHMTDACIYHISHNNESFRAWQMFYPDKNGIFPWEEGCNPDIVERQRMKA